MGGPNSCANLYMEESGFSKKYVSTRCRMVLQMSFLLMQADGIHIVVAGHEQTDVDLIHRVMYKRQKDIEAIMLDNPRILELY